MEGDQKLAETYGRGVSEFMVFSEPEKRLADLRATKEACDKARRPGGTYDASLYVG